MLSLGLAILSSASMSIILRFSENRSENKYGVLAMNYLAAIIMGFFQLQEKTWYPGHEADFAVGLGLLNGILYLVTLLFLQLNIRKNGVILSSTFAKLGVVVPTIFAMVFFHEVPKALQILGLIVAVAAIIVIHFEKQSSLVNFKIGLVILMFLSGTADSLAKVFEYMGQRKLDAHFLFYTFITAFLLCIVLLVYKKQRIGRKDILYGFLIGIPNYLSMLFLLRALTTLPAVITYPSYSAGTIIVVSVVGIFAFKERLSKKQWGGLALIVCALVLLNM